MKVTKRIKKIVDRANQAIYNLCLCHLTSDDKSNTKQKRAVAERSAKFFGGYRIALLDALEILGFDLDKDVELDVYSDAMKKALKDYKQGGEE